MEPETVDPGVQRFGAYLRRVRESKRLSLDSVEEMSAGFPERITKSHLSRIENGLAIPTFPRLMALGDIYGMPLSVLADRFEIETRSDPAAGARESLTDAELIEECRRAYVAGRFRDCLAVYSILYERQLGAAPDDARRRRLLELRVQRLDAMVQLGHHESAKVECEQMLDDPGLDGRLRVHVLHVFSVACRKLGRYMAAMMGLDLAEKEASAVPEAPSKMLADLLMLRANLLKDTGRPDEAVPRYADAVTRYEAAGDVLDATMARVNLGDALARAGRAAEARTLLLETLGVTRDRGYERLEAVTLSHLGAIEFRDGRMRESESFCIRSNTIARELGHLSIVFRNCFYLMKIYRASDDETGARVNERTLKAYVGRIEETLPEAQEYRAELAGGEE